MISEESINRLYQLPFIGLDINNDLLLRRLTSSEVKAVFSADWLFPILECNSARFKVENSCNFDFGEELKFKRFGVVQWMHPKTVAFGS